MTAHRQLLLLRHAKAAHDEGVADHERPLTERGELAAAAMGRWLREQEVTLDAVWCSSALRARQTWERAASALPAAPEASYLRELYQAGPDELLELVRQAPGGVRSLLVVGHNPTMQQTLEELTDAPHDFPTGALAVVGLAGKWPALESARLLDFVTPKQL